MPMPSSLWGCPMEFLRWPQFIRALFAIDDDALNSLLSHIWMKTSIPQIWAASTLKRRSSNKLPHVSNTLVSQDEKQTLGHRYLTNQNFYVSVKMLNFWCEFSFWKFYRKSQRTKRIMKISDKKVTSKNKGKKIWKVPEKNYKWKKPLNFICHWILILKIPLKFVMIF